MLPTRLCGILKVGKTKHRLAITDEQQLGQLLRNINKNVGRGDIAIDYAVRILPHVFVRPGVTSCKVGGYRF